MATKNFRSTVLEPTSEFAHGDKLRFTALATVGEVLKGSFSETTIGEDGVYSVDLQYGKHRIDYKPYEGVWRHFADIEVNADTLATTLQDLSLSSVPVTDEAVLVLQGILADAESAKTAAETAEAAAETALASIDSKIAEVEAGYPSLLAAQLSKKIYVNVATGDDTTADGSSAKPYKTIMAAVYSTPKICSLIIILQGSSSKSDAHVIDATIDLAHRFLEIQFSSNHVILADSMSTVFTGGNGSVLYFSDGNGGHNQYLHASTNKTILQANGESTFHMGGYNSTIFYVSDSAKITLIQTGYTGARGVSRLTSSKLTFRNAENTAAASSEVVSVYAYSAGSVLVNHWGASMGTNYKEFATASNVATIVGTLKAVSS